MTSRLDIIIFGATGFTGKRTVEKIVYLLRVEELNLTWGIAGRSEQKLKDVLEDIGKKCETNLSTIPTIIADVNDGDSLEKMTAQARVLITTVGPYMLYGEPVVKACVATSTNYIDITAEVTFIELIHSKYNEIATQKGIYIISACGLDCIPSDLGVVFMQQNFDGFLNSVTGYVAVQTGTSPGPIANYGTWTSAVNEWSTLRRMVTERLSAYEKTISSFNPKLPRKGLLHKNSVDNNWATPLYSADSVIIIRSQKFFHQYYQERPLHLQAFGCVNSNLNLLIASIYLPIFDVLSRFKFGRNLLLKYPRFFSYGLVDHGGPSDEKQNETKLEITLVGEGWSGIQDRHPSPPDKVVKARIWGFNPGYGLCCVATVLSAIMVLTEKSKMPKDGGVLSTGAAFAKTSIIEKLQKYGLKFEII